jgi:hypothetical protein
VINREYLEEESRGGTLALSNPWRGGCISAAVIEGTSIRLQNSLCCNSDGLRNAELVKVLVEPTEREVREQKRGVKI